MAKRIKKIRMMIYDLEEAIDLAYMYDHTYHPSFTRNSILLAVLKPTLKVLELINKIFNKS